MNRTICAHALVFTLIAGFASGQDEKPDKPTITPAEVTQFLAAMTDDVERWHLKSDPKSEQRGTLNEFVVRTFLKGDKLPETDQGQWGQWIQAGAGDTYHSAAYYVAGMIHAWRATGDERYLHAAKTQHLPLMVRMSRESDTLFPEQIPTFRAGVEMKIEKPMKGYIPFWWDDGSTRFLKPMPASDKYIGGTGEDPVAIRQGYIRSVSQHLAQSLGVMFIEAWWMDRDPLIAEATVLHQQFWDQVSPWGNMWSVAAPAGLISGNQKWLRAGANIWKSPYEAGRGAMGVRYQRKRKFQGPAIADGQHYRYYGDLAANAGKLSDENAAYLINQGLNHSLLPEAWSDDPPFQPGIERYDRGKGTWYWIHGKPHIYRSKREVPHGSRKGPQHLVLTALGMQALRGKPDLWDSLPGEFPDDLVVPIQQSPQNAETWSESWVPGEGTSLQLAARRHSLRIRGNVRGDSIEIRVRLTQPEVIPKNRQGERRPEGVFTIAAAGAKAANDEGEVLALTTKTVTPAAGGFSFEIEIPYTRMKGQNEWINGADHFRYEVIVGDQTRIANLHTPAKDVGPFLEDFVERGLANWKRVFDEKGYIPGTMYKKSEWGPEDNSNISHLYGYAFLTSACAQYLIYLDGKNYWDLLTASGAQMMHNPKRGVVMQPTISIR